MVKIEKRLIKHGHSESHLKSLAEYLERNLSRDLGPKAEAGSMRSESGYQRIAASVSGRIARELGCSEYKAKALSLGIGLCFPKYGHEGFKAVKQYITENDIDLELDTLELIAACYSAQRYAKRYRVDDYKVVVSTAFYNLVYDYVYGIDNYTESKIVRLVQETIMDVKKCEVFYDGNSGNLLFDATNELVDLVKEHKTLVRGTLLDNYKDKINDYQFPTLTEEEHDEIYKRIDELIESFTSLPEDLKDLGGSPEDAVLLYITSGLYC